MVCCRSSVVERILGKAEVGSSILPGSTMAESGCEQGAALSRRLTERPAGVRAASLTDTSDARALPAIFLLLLDAPGGLGGLAAGRADRCIAGGWRARGAAGDQAAESAEAGQDKEEQKVRRSRTRRTGRGLRATTQPAGPSASLETSASRWLSPPAAWSGRQDSNLRPSAPKADALPDCATPRPMPADLRLSRAGPAGQAWGRGGRSGAAIPARHECNRPCQFDSLGSPVGV